MDRWIEFPTGLFYLGVRSNIKLNFDGGDYGHSILLHFYLKIYFVNWFRSPRVSCSDINHVFYKIIKQGRFRLFSKKSKIFGRMKWH